MTTNLPKSDGTTDHDDNVNAPRTVKLNLTGLHRSIRQAEEAMAGIRRIVRAQGAMHRRFQERLSEIMGPVEDLSRRMEAIIDAHHQTWEHFSRTMEQVVEQAILPELKMAELRSALDAPLRLSETIAASRIEMASVVEAALQARAGEVAVQDAAVAAERIIDEVSRPPVEGSETDAVRFLIRRICAAGEALGLDRSGVVTIVLAVVIALVQGRWTGRQIEGVERTVENGFDRVERQLDQSLENDRQKLEAVEDLIEEADSLRGSACQPSEEGG